MTPSMRNEPEKFLKRLSRRPARQRGLILVVAGLICGKLEIYDVWREAMAGSGDARLEGWLVPFSIVGLVFGPLLLIFGDKLERLTWDPQRKRPSLFGAILGIPILIFCIASFLWLDIQISTQPHR